MARLLRSLVLLVFYGAAAGVLVMLLSLLALELVDSLVHPTFRHLDGAGFVVLGVILVPATVAAVHRFIQAVAELL